MKRSAGGPPVASVAVADDSAEIRTVLEAVFEYSEAHQLTAVFDSGAEIVQWAQSGGRADVLVIDMRMPRFSGAATIRVLRTHMPNARIVAFSASTHARSIEAAFEAGADRYVSKDSSLAEVLAAVAPGDHFHAGESDVSNRDRPTTGPVSIGAAEPRTTPTGFIDVSGNTPFSVLVVDDHELVRTATVILLEQFGGFQVAAAASGENAIKQIDEAGKFDCVLVDWRLPGMSGSDLVRAIRARQPAIAVVIHSGALHDELDDELQGVDIDGFVSKGSCSGAELSAVVVDAVARRRSLLAHLQTDRR